ncbi:hypothetical protein DFS34DRAFT_651404 [Phlyctochytrium arcticum]|nr:hypothetical protein DFS34DRAFT_651404 [Phlyctochytrium arcticum]
MADGAGRETAGNEATRRRVDPALTCDSRELQECLQKNNGDRSKCQAEWEAFRKACSEKAAATKSR